MAILNWIQPGTYSIVKISQFDHHQRVIGLDVETYSDSTKLNCLQNTGYQLFAQEYRNVVSKGWQAPPEGNYAPGTCFWVNGQGQGDWADFNNQIVMWFSNQWTPVTLAEKQIIYALDEGLYYFLSPSYTWVLMNPLPLTAERWDTFFGIEAQDIEGNNIFKLAYTYLHTLPQFLSTTPG